MNVFDKEAFDRKNEGEARTSVHGNPYRGEVMG
jgi:hypothetical protein